MKQALESLIMKIDFVGPKPKFNHLGSETYSSYMGVFITLVAVAITMISNRSTIEDCAYSTNPQQLSWVDSKIDDYVKMKGNFTLIFSITGNNSMIDSNYNYNLYESTERSSNLIKADISTSISDYENIIINNNLQESPALSLLNSPFQIQYQNYSLDSNSSTLVTSKLSYCNNSFTDNITYSYDKENTYFFCLPDQFFEDSIAINSNVLKTPYFKIFITKEDLLSTIQTLNINYLEIKYYYYDFTFFDSLYSVDLDYKTITLFSNSLVKSSFVLQYTQLFIQGNGFIFKPSQKLFSDIFGITDFSVDTMYYYNVNSDNNSLSLNFLFTNYKKSNLVIYVSVDDVISCIGGTISVILFAFKVIYEFFAEYYLRVSMINSVFSFHYYNDDKKPEKKIKNDFSRRKYIRNFDRAFSLISVNRKQDSNNLVNNFNKKYNDLNETEGDINDNNKPYYKKSFNIARNTLNNINETTENEDSVIVNDNNNINGVFNDLLDHSVYDARNSLNDEYSGNISNSFGKNVFTNLENYYSNLNNHILNTDSRDSPEQRTSKSYEYLGIATSNKDSKYKQIRKESENFHGSLDNIINTSGNIVDNNLFNNLNNNRVFSFNDEYENFKSDRKESKNSNKKNNNMLNFNSRKSKIVVDNILNSKNIIINDDNKKKDEFLMKHKFGVNECKEDSEFQSRKESNDIDVDEGCINEEFSSKHRYMTGIKINNSEQIKTNNKLKLKFINIPTLPKLRNSKLNNALETSPLRSGIKQNNNLTEENITGNSNTSDLVHLQYNQTGVNLNTPNKKDILESSNNENNNNTDNLIKKDYNKCLTPNPIYHNHRKVNKHQSNKTNKSNTNSNNSTSNNANKKKKGIHKSSDVSATSIINNRKISFFNFKRKEKSKYIKRIALFENLLPKSYIEKKKTLQGMQDKCEKEQQLQQSIVNQTKNNDNNSNVFINLNSKSNNKLNFLYSFNDVKNSDRNSIINKRNSCINSNNIKTKELYTPLLGVNINTPDITTPKLVLKKTNISDDSLDSTNINLNNKKTTSNNININQQQSKLPINIFSNEDKEIFNKFFNILNKRQKTKIHCWDYFKASFFKLIWRPLTLKQRIVLNSDDLLQAKLNYESYMKMNYDIQMIKNMIINKDLVDIACIPSFNIYSNDSIEFANLGFNSSMKFWEHESSLFKILESDFATERASRKVWENYLNSCF